MKRFALALVVALIMPVGSPAADNDPITRQQADDILRELQQIRKMLQQSPRGEGGTRAPAAAPSNITMSLENTRFIGSESAPLTIVEFTDFQCPFCQRFHLTAFKSIKEKYIDTGIVRFYSRDLPLEMHKNAFRAAQAGRCADEQGHFWEMRNLLQSNSEKLAPENLAQYAADLTLDGDQFQLCVSGEKYRLGHEIGARWS